MSRKYTVLKLYGGRRKTEETIPAAQEKTCAETPPRQVSCTGPGSYKDL